MCGVAAAALVAAVTVACAAGTERATSTPSPVETTTEQEAPIGMPNPASVYCLEQGGELETRTDADGNQSGFCIFPDGTEKNQWEYWRENHPAGDEPAVEREGPVGLANPASVYCLEQGGRLEMRSDADGNQSGYCIFPDGTEKNQWDFWRENHPVGAQAGIVAEETRPDVEPPGPPRIERQVSVEEGEEIARRFVLESATYQFDGSEGSLELVSTMTMRCPSCWAFDFEFESALAGYGDRTGKDVVEVITPHRVVVVVERGRITSAVMDGEWDMLFQKGMAAQEESEQVAREFVLNTPTYLFDGIEGSLTLVERFDAFCPYCWGYVFKYKSAHAGYGDRSGQVLAQVITEHEILVSTSGGAVDGATVDRQWDVVAQSPIKPPVVVTAVAPAPVEPATGSEVGAVMSEEESEKLARGFVRDSRTFELDGIEESLKLVETLQARCPGCWAFVYTFDSRHAGYGDRSDQMLAQVITLHKASVMVEQGKVVRAVLDGEWDMMAQEMVQ